MNEPSWFKSITWSEPVEIEVLRYKRGLLPMSPGVYVFTNNPMVLEKNTGVLYVGEAKQSLYKRVQSYLTDPNELLILSKSGLKTSSSLKHAGKALLLMDIQQRFRAFGSGESGIWVRWHQCAAPSTLEAQLIRYLMPAFNTLNKPS